ncbi:MAG: YncE family protein [Vulcanimicrobiaceae bacterium]
MPLIPIAAPQAVAPGGGFDYVTVDAQRRRVYAAHGGAKALLIADADSGKVLGLVQVGPMAGVAVDPATGHVFTGNGRAQSVSEVDPVAMKVVRTVKVPGHVDAIAYDPKLKRIYADEGDGTRMFVIDTTTFKQIATVALPGHKPEYLQVDPQTHDVYQNISNLGEIAVIDPHTLKVSRVFATPQLTNNHPLQYDAKAHVLLAAGENGTLAAYDRHGKLVHSIAYPGTVDQCSFDPSRGWLACAGTSLVLFSIDATGAPKLLASRVIAKGFHTTAIDEKTGTMWAVWGDRSTGKAFLQGYAYKP